jgi:hypothetical protein
MTGAESLRPEARPGFELTSFEEVRATPTTSLLRLTGRWRGPGRPPASPALVIEAGGRRERLMPLAGPPAQSGSIWRAGYAIPPDALATPGVRLALDAGDLVPLPLPSRVREPSIAPQARGATSVSASRSRGDVVSLRLSDADRREREKIERLTRELERAHREVESLRQFEQRLAKSEAALAGAEAQIETLRAQLQEARAHAADLAARSSREQR